MGNTRALSLWYFCVSPYVLHPTPTCWIRNAIVLTSKPAQAKKGDVKTFLLVVYKQMAMAMTIGGVGYLLVGALVWYFACPRLHPQARVDNESK